MPLNAKQQAILDAHKAKSSSKSTVDNSVPDGDIAAYKGDTGKGAIKNGSVYSDQEWKDFAKKYYPNVKTRKELQNAIINDTEHPEFGNEVKNLHEQFGHLKADQNPIDGRLGHRWDAILAKSKVVVPTSETKTPANPGPQRGSTPSYVNQPANAPWWIQDVINTAGAAGDRLSLKKYLPWAPQVELQTPRATFFDPTRELAANAENTAIGTEGAGMFAGPQAYNSRFSQIQGAGAKNAANILSNYHNKNVGVANQFENIRTGIYNQNSQMNAGVAKNLYDGTTIANQQFDNAKREANAEIRTQYNTALTNRAMTQTLNTMYPNYQVDPSHGGMPGFYKGSPVNPNDSYGIDERAKAIVRVRQENPGLKDQDIAYLFDERRKNGYLDNQSQEAFNANMEQRAPLKRDGGTTEKEWYNTFVNAFPTRKR